MKRRVIIYVIGAICSIGIIRLWPGFYTHITHMNTEDLAWAKNRYTGEIFYFQDENRRLDKVSITTIDIYNSLNPINNEAAWSSYHAFISIDYILFRHQGDQIDGCIIMKKEKNFESLYFLGGFDHLYCGNYYRPVRLDFTRMKIGERVLTDCVIFNAENSTLFDSLDVLSENLIVSYAWSKQYGLVQYSFRDGTVFNRIDLE